MERKRTRWEHGTEKKEGQQLEMHKDPKEMEIQTDKEERNGPITNNKYNVPKDEGWSWFVLLGAFLQMTLIIGNLKTGGIIFVAFQEKFGSTSSMTSLLSTLQNIMYSLTAPIVLCVGKQLTSSRILVTTGTLIVTTAYIITSQSTDIRILFFSHGILQGFGTAFLQPVVIVTLASYFEKKRGLANSLAVSGGSLGGLIFAPLYTYLLKEYGYQGCFLIIAAILFHGSICASLFRPHSFYKIKPRKRTPIVKVDSGVESVALLVKTSDTSNGISETETANGGSLKKMNDETKHSGALEDGRTESLDAVTTRGDHNGRVCHDENKGIRIRSLSETSRTSQLPNKQLANSQTNIYISMEYMCGSMMDINSKSQDEPKSDNNTNKKSTEDKKSIMTTIKALLKLLISSFEFKLFKNPLFCILQLASILIYANSLLLTVYIAPHARDMGLQGEDIALIVTVFSSTDFVSRIVVALVADRDWIRRSNITASSLFVVAVASNLMRFYGSLNSLIVYGAILGLFSSVYFSMFAVLIVDYLTIHKLQAAFGFTSLFHGAGISMFYYIIGQLRDVTGSYIVPFHLMGCLCFVGSALHFSLPFVERYQKRKEHKNTNADIL